MLTRISVPLVALATLLLSGSPLAAQAPDAAIVKANDQLVKAFNAGQVAGVVAQFAAEGELIDEEGNLYRGEKELAALFTKFFERFPGAKLAMEIESIRAIGPNLAMEEGTRYIAAREGVAKATLRYSAVRTRTAAGQWLIASIREFNNDPLPTPHERLAALGWVVGDWVNEGTDGLVKISFRWSEEGNFILGDYQVHLTGRPAMKSTQRIGWDPVAGRIRSWLFDADGGFAEGHWAAVEGGFVVKSNSSNPDGSSGSVTMTITPKGKDHFTMTGTDRIIGEARAPDFEVSVVRQPPAAGK